MVGQPAPGCTWPAHTGHQSAGSSQHSHRTIPVCVSVCVICEGVCVCIFSGVGSNHALWGPQIQIVGVALITEFCDPNIRFLKVVF